MNVEEQLGDRINKLEDRIDKLIDLCCEMSNMCTIMSKPILYLNEKDLGDSTDRGER